MRSRSSEKFISPYRYSRNTNRTIARIRVGIRCSLVGLLFQYFFDCLFGAFRAKDLTSYGSVQLQETFSTKTQFISGNAPPVFVGIIIVLCFGRVVCLAHGVCVHVVRVDRENIYERMAETFWSEGITVFKLEV